MYTLPTNTSIRLRQPSRQLLALVRTVFADAPIVRISVELTSWVERSREPAFHRRAYSWYELATGGVQPIYASYQPFEIEPGFALFMWAGGDVTAYLQAFTDELEQVMALDVARDALLEGRDHVAARILRDALPHAAPLFAALIRKERNLLAQR